MLILRWRSMLCDLDLISMSQKETETFIVYVDWQMLRLSGPAVNCSIDDYF